MMTSPMLDDDVLEHQWESLLAAKQEETRQPNLPPDQAFQKALEAKMSVCALNIAYSLHQAMKEDPGIEGFSYALNEGADKEWMLAVCVATLAWDEHEWRWEDDEWPEDEQHHLSQTDVDALSCELRGHLMEAFKRTSGEKVSMVGQMVFGERPFLRQGMLDEEGQTKEELCMAASFTRDNQYEVIERLLGENVMSRLRQEKLSDAWSEVPSEPSEKTKFRF